MGQQLRNITRATLLVLSAALLTQGPGQLASAQGQQPQPAAGVSGAVPPTEQSAQIEEVKPLHIGGNVKPPALLKRAEPKYSEEARRKKIGGDIMIYCWVERDGSVSHVRVTRGVGYGLDEAAADAVRSYRFRPATQDGAPVIVDMHIEVTFRIR